MLGFEDCRYSLQPLLALRWQIQKETRTGPYHCLQKEIRTEEKSKFSDGKHLRHFSVTREREALSSIYLQAQTNTNKHK